MMKTITITRGQLAAISAKGDIEKIDDLQRRGSPLVAIVGRQIHHIIDDSDAVILRLCESTTTTVTIEEK